MNKITDKDKKNWKNFIDSKDNIEDKDSFNLKPKDKNNQILSGDSKKVKKVFDTWKFSRDIRSSNPNWLLVDTQA